MKHIVIGFEDVSKDFNPLNNVIFRLLSKDYDVEIADLSTAEGKASVQYLFYSAFGNHYLDYHCIRIFVTGENLCPNFNLCDYALGFERMDFEDRYLRFPIFLWDQYAKDYELIESTRKALLDKTPEKRKFCAMVVSNNNFANDMRKNLFDGLSKYKRVDSGGKAYNNIGKPEGVADKAEFLSGYKFSIASENSTYSGYCTEKLMQAFSAGNVPIYWGDPKVSSEFNKNAFIDCTGLTIDEAVKKVEEIDKDDDKYLSMLSEPALLDSDYKIKMEQKLSSWLRNIIDQDYEKARRIPRQGKMAVYEQNYRKRVKMEEKIKKHSKLYSVAKAVFGKGITK